MAKDAYGNDVVDPFDLAIAQGVMRATWGSAIAAAVLNLVAGCCFGTSMAVLGPAVAGFVMILVALISVGSAVNVAIRVFTMQPDHKALVPSWHPWGALGLAVAGAAFAALQIVFGSVYLATYGF